MEQNVQVSNAGGDDVFTESNYQSAPESTDFNSGDFFEALDNEVNGGILDQPSREQTTSDNLENVGNEFLEEQETQRRPENMSPVEGQDSDIENLQKRYSDSSKEAKRLHKTLSELEPYLPILDAMREDPNLIQHVRGYFEGGGQAPVSMKEQLNLGEDFIFDPDDAMGNPESDSAKVLAATIDGVVQKRLNNVLAKQQVDNQRLTRESEFRQKYSMGDEEWANFVKFAKGKTLQLDDIYYLMNKGKREQNIAKSANEQVSQQMKKVQQKPQSLATAGSQQVQDKTPDDSVFETILGLDSELDKAFGM